MILAALEAMKTRPEAARSSLDHSGWLEDDADLEALYAEWRRRFAAAIAPVRAAFGPPTHDGAGDREWLDPICPDAIEAVGWQRPDGLYYAALEHADREAPIGIIAGKWVE